MPKKKVKKVRVQTYMPPTMVKSIKAVADKQGVTVSEVLVAATHMYLSEHHPHATFMSYLEEA
jgi:predicted DNA-binding protein (UPF0278 family)